jgi:hypothetical protein
VQEQIGEDGRDRRTLRGSPIPFSQRPVGQLLLAAASDEDDGVTFADDIR